MDVWSEVPGAYTVILNGGQSNTGWVCTATSTGTINVTAMPWVQFSAASTYFAGTGLTLASNTFSITNTGVTASSYGSASQTLTATVNAQGQLTSLSASNIAISASQTTSGTFSSSLLSGQYTGITGVGTLTAGTWNASTIGVAYGGTGATTLTGYVKGSGTSAFTATTTIPNTDITGLGTMSTQNANSVAITGGSATLGTLITSGLTGYLYGNGGSAVTASTTIPTSALSGNFVASFSAGTTGLTPNTNTTGIVTLGGTLNVANGGTGVTSSSGANSVVLRDANGNITTNCLFEGFTSVAASGTTTTLVASSVQNWVVTGSGGQTFKLPDATTLPNGAQFNFNNNQSSGAITVVNNSSTTVATIQSGGFTTVVLISNSIAAGSWDRHDQGPSNVSWSTNTFDYPGSITSATWNGNVVAINRGGTNGTATPTAGGVAYGSGTSYAFTSVGTTGQVLTSNGSGTPTWSTPASSITLSDDTTTNATRYPLFANATSGTISTEYVSSTKYQFNPSTGVLTSTSFSGAGTGLTGTASSLSIGGNAATATSATTSTNLAGGASGSLPYQSGSGATTFLAAGTNGYILTLASGVPSWAAAPVTGVTISDDTTTNATRYLTFTSATTGTITSENVSSTKLQFNPSTGAFTATSLTPTNALGATYGGTGQTSYTTGDIIYASGTNTLSKLAAGTNGYVLTLSGGVPTWAASGGGGLVNSVVGTSPINVSTALGIATVSLNSAYGDTLNPYGSKTANYILAAPNGSVGTPSFRAIVAADIPTLNQNTTGTASNVTGTVAIANGGTGQTTASAAFNALSPVTSTGDLIIGNGTNSSTRLAIGTNGYVLTSNGTTASWAAATGGGGVTWQSVQTTGFTATAGNAYPCNTTSAAFTVTLPASPSAGNIITLTDYAGTWATNNLTIGANGNKINGITSNAVLATNRESVSLVYIDATQGWIAYSGFLDSALPQTYSIDYLVVAGGGGGGGIQVGSGIAGGGGAGGYRTGTATVTPGTGYSATVGGGGAGGAATGQVGASGTNTTFNSTTSTGGGGGSAGRDTNLGGVSGGSGGGGGGGGGGTGQTAGSGTAGQGNNGGVGYTAPNYGSGGGGGAGAAGSAGTTTGGGNGGAGLNWQSLGTYYAGGGGGASYFAGGTQGTGGAGGGGNGSNTGAGGAASANTGGGGGGTGKDNTGAVGGNGGSGVVIVRYSGSQRGTGGTVTSAGGYTYHTFTSSGTFTA